MRERGRYQLQLMKTRSSSGVNSKIDLEFDAMVCWDCYESMMYEMHGEDYISERDVDVKDFNKSFEQPKSANDYLGW